MVAIKKLTSMNSCKRWSLSISRCMMCSMLKIRERTWLGTIKSIHRMQGHSLRKCKIHNRSTWLTLSIWIFNSMTSTKLYRLGKVLAVCHSYSLRIKWETSAKWACLPIRHTWANRAQWAPTNSTWLSRALHHWGRPRHSRIYMPAVQCNRERQ